MATWVVFANAAAFNAYHAATCAAAGVPRAGYNVASGTVAINAAWTQAVAQPVYDGPNALSPIKAAVPDADVATYGLTVTTAPTAAPTAYPASAIAKPPTWTDPKTGITWNTSTGQPV